MIVFIIEVIKMDKPKITGNNHWIEIEYNKPEWSDDLEASFRYKGELYYLSDIMDLTNKFYNPNPPDWMKGYHGYRSDSFFSGILIKLSDCGDAVKAYWYCS
jgi:hypothetical protein